MQIKIKINQMKLLLVQKKEMVSLQERTFLETEVYALVNKPDKCPYCSNKKAGYGNDLKLTIQKLQKSGTTKKRYKSRKSSSTN